MLSDRLMFSYVPNSSTSIAAAITARMNATAAVTASRTATISVRFMPYRWGHNSGRIIASPGTPSGAE